MNSEELYFTEEQTPRKYKRGAYKKRRIIEECISDLTPNLNSIDSLEKTRLEQLLRPKIIFLFTNNYIDKEDTIALLHLLINGSYYTLLRQIRCFEKKVNKDINELVLRIKQQPATKQTNEKFNEAVDNMALDTLIDELYEELSGLKELSNTKI